MAVTAGFTAGFTAIAWSKVNGGDTVYIEAKAGTGAEPQVSGPYVIVSVKAKTLRWRGVGPEFSHTAEELRVKA